MITCRVLHSPRGGNGGEEREGQEAPFTLLLQYWYIGLVAEGATQSPPERGHTFVLLP